MENSGGKNDQPDYRHSIEALAKAAVGFVGLVDLLLTTAATALQRRPPLFNTLAEIDWQEVQTRLEELPALSKQCMRRVLSNGWFFGWHDSLETLSVLIDDLLASAEENIDEIMIAFYTARFSEYADRLATKHPVRSAPIIAATKAHTAEAYLLSIPVFIAQADGLLAEMFGKENPLREIRQLVERRFADDQGTLDLLLPLLEINDSKFLLSSGRRGADFEGLNRHQVMHGEVSDYGTEANSLKAFSFLVFVGLHLPAAAPDLVKR